MKITRRQLRQIVLEACECGSSPETGYASISSMSLQDIIALILAVTKSHDIDPSTVEDAFHPSEVEAREGAWSGGDNIEDPLDHAYFETRESNAGPHVTLQYKNIRENKMKITRSQLRQIIKEVVTTDTGRVIDPEELKRFPKTAASVDELLHADIVSSVYDAIADTALLNVGKDRESIVLTGIDNELELREMEGEEVDMTQIDLEKIFRDVMTDLKMAEKRK